MTFENKLPSGYTTGTIDLDGDKKLSLRLYAAAAAVAVVLTVVCCFLKDISLLFDASGVFALLGRFVLIMLITGFLPCRAGAFKMYYHRQAHRQACARRARQDERIY